MNDNWFDTAQGLSAIISPLIAVAGFIFVYKQIKQANSSIRHSSHVAIYQISSEFYKYLSDNPDLRPYFYDNKAFKADDPLAQRLLGMSEYLADFFEFMLIESEDLDKNIYKSWIGYMHNVYSKSEVFRYYLSTYKDNYTPELLETFSSLQHP